MKSNTLAAIAYEMDRPVTAAAVRRALEEPISADERDEVLSLVRWFTRRYPTPADRLACLRRAHTRSRRTASRSGWSG